MGRKEEEEEEEEKKDGEEKEHFFLALSFHHSSYGTQIRTPEERLVIGSNRPLNYKSFDPTPLFGLSILYRLVLYSSCLCACAPLSHLTFKPSKVQTPSESL